MARRLPSTPPNLPGFSYVRALGSGGFADVFLYEQNMPRRQVAVKVMLSEVVNDHVRQMFQAEANLMAQLSTHPSILTVYQASVSADGRPYLVMELCSAVLSERYRKDQLPVAEVLHIGIKIASAIETAHRAGVLHRDIKPTNILTTAYGHPVLSDFGIAATLAESEQTESVGLSIPWSAPEVLMDETAGSISSEVWSMAATVYSLLAGRSPFEVPGDSNKSADLIARINRAKPEPIGRADVPPRLELILQRAMSKRPENRPRSVLELIRELQSVETELGVPQTPLEVAMDDWALATVADLEDRTRIRGLVTAPADTGRRRRRSRSVEQSGSVLVGVRPARTRSSEPAAASVVVPSAPRRMSMLGWGIVGTAVLVIAFGATAATVLLRDSAQIPRVSDISAVVSDGMVDFSWKDPGLRTGDSYDVATDDGTSSQKSSTFSVPASAGEHICIRVRVNRDGDLGEYSNEKCVDA
ncbi:serine/threonine-protein kinase [Naasia lichenicola]|uniref:non-specific serine/threonine protein kinase n=1 Tax=Naasia lichenicola TaxID=2565933 RepID=A0A4S4FLZ2_9MICO|nr:serine/threonine-protein kinase [Naasia lichenicola]THG31480.1 serine/threonine protein kinase [Naasia lichenicola]